VEPVQISPEPAEAERKAILAALAAEEAGRKSVSALADALLPARPGAEEEP
jgi:hypothetical protein